MGGALVVLAAALALTACTGSHDPERLPTSATTERRLATVPAFMRSMSLDGPIARMTVYARADATDADIAAPCQQLGVGKPVAPIKKTIAANGVVVAELACSGGIVAREHSSPNYPQTGQTYLSFGPPEGNPLIKGHGFQVTYFETTDRVWLWYPGNRRALPGAWKLEDADLCFNYGSNTYNPVTKQTGGGFRCGSLRLARNQIVSELSGDAFGIATGSVPYPLERCTAPPEFVFDRQEFGC